MACRCHYRGVRRIHIVRIIALFICMNFVWFYEPHESIHTCKGIVTFKEDEPNFMPRIIHVFTSNESTPVQYAIQAYGKYQRERVMINHSVNYTFMQWNTSYFYEWMNTNYGWYVPLLSRIDQEHVQDIAPFFILHAHGGIFLAPNYIPRVDLFPYISPDRVTLLETNLPYVEKASSALVASIKGHLFWTIVHEKLLASGVSFNLNIFLSDLVIKYHHMIYLLSCKNFNRISEKTSLKVVRDTKLSTKCGLEEDPCLYGSLQ